MYCETGLTKLATETAGCSAGRVGVTPFWGGYRNVLEKTGGAISLYCAAGGSAVRVTAAAAAEAFESAAEPPRNTATTANAATAVPSATSAGRSHRSPREVILMNQRPSPDRACAARGS